MTTLTIARPAASAAPRAKQGLAARFVFWLLALDAGYRNAHALAHATESRLADMGLTRTDADAEFARHTGSAARPVSSGW